MVLSLSNYWPLDPPCRLLAADVAPEASLAWGALCCIHTISSLSLQNENFLLGPLGRLVGLYAVQTRYHSKHNNKKLGELKKCKSNSRTKRKD